MTKNDELACNPVLAYADSYRSMANQGSESVPVWGVITDLERNIAPLYTALLAERDADKKVIADLERDVDAANSRVDTKCAQLCNQDEEIEMLRLRIAELEALTAEQDNRLLSYASIAAKNASEARTVSVKLPKPHAHLIWIQAGRGPDDYWDDVAVSHSLKDLCCDGSERYPVYSIFEIQDACAAAGIKLEVGE